MKNTLLTFGYVNFDYFHLIQELFKKHSIITKILNKIFNV
jgi:hypothetical protein